MSASPAQVVAADWTWTGKGFEPGIRIAVGADGRIVEVGKLPVAPTHPMPGRALLPGWINAHSHAFQRGLRGHGESFPAGAGSFWTWREAMYRLVEELGEESFERLSTQAFREMRRAGITTVGEFHYLHHGPGGEVDYRLDERLLAAAQAAGIRLVLLETFYRTAGFAPGPADPARRLAGPPGQPAGAASLAGPADPAKHPVGSSGSAGFGPGDRPPLAGAQRRFLTPDPASFWKQMDHLAGRLRGPEQTLGVAVHSLRAASPEDLAEIYREARRRGLPVHIHVEEQRREIEECLAASGRRPMALILASLGEIEGLCAVHCTHTAPEDLARFLDGGGRLCVCPLTEANLGDGIPDLSRCVAGVHGLCLGTDSNARIAMLEEMRWLEYGQRLRGERRGALRDGAGGIARSLLRAATAGGADALGLPSGRIAAGLWADLVAVDLAAPELAGWEPESLLPALIFGAGEGAIAATCVGGQWQEHGTEVNRCAAVTP